MGHQIPVLVLIVLNVMIFSKIILATIRLKKQHQEVLSLLEKLQKKQSSGVAFPLIGD